MPLSRREFLLGGLGAAGAGAAGLLVSRHGSAAQPAARPGAPGAATPAGVTGSGTDGILVLLTLYGGNDGLNTVIPYQDGSYLGGRRTLGYQPDQVLPLTDGLALHPNLTGMKSLWDAKRLAIVRGVGYPSPNRSHFRSMDIWQSAVPDDSVTTGWIGRWLDTSGSDPMRALSIGGSLPRIFGGETAAGAAVPVGPLTLPGGAPVQSGFAALTVASRGSSPLAARISQSGADLLTVDHAIADLVSGQLQSADTVGPTATLEGTPAGNALAEQLDLVARLVKGGSPTRVYGVNLGGFDTHANEKDTHARLMGYLDSAVSGFFKNLAGSAQEGRVVLAAYSEFGRRVAANGSDGTDHGTAAPMFVVGPRVKGGFYGDEPSLSDLDAGDLKFTTDFRSVYATLLQEVVGVDAKASLGKAFAPVPFL
jgi:uncharacterized protein (DUF1501 family)